MSNVRCHCCQSNLCFYHLKKHYDRPLDRANHLVDQINTLGERVRTFNREQFLRQAKEKLDDWREKSYGAIDRFYEEKFQELDQIVEEKIHRQEEQWLEIKRTMDQIFEDQATTDEEMNQMERTLQNLDGRLRQIEQITVEIDEPTLIIDRKNIRIAEKFDLQTICTSRTGRTIECPDIKSSILASNEQCLLVHQNVHLCFFDDQGVLLKKLPWKFGKISDACWSARLNRFVICSENCGICFVHDKTISIADSRCFRNDKLHSCTASTGSLFASTDGPSAKVMEFGLAPSIKLLRQWKSPEVCARDGTISSLRYHDQKLALMIRKPTEKMLSIELRSTANFQRLWSVEFELDARPHLFGLSTFYGGHWLLVCPNSSRLIHITKDGHLKETHSYRCRPMNAVLFGRDRLAVLTENSIDVHPIAEHVHFF